MRESDRLAQLRADLLVEEHPGQLSEVLGWPSVTVASRYGQVGLHAAEPPIKSVLEALEAFELECPECPQAWTNPSGIRDEPT